MWDIILLRNKVHCRKRKLMKTPKRLQIYISQLLCGKTNYSTLFLTVYPDFYNTRPFFVRGLIPKCWNSAKPCNKQGIRANRPITDFIYTRVAALESFWPVVVIAKRVWFIYSIWESSGASSSLFEDVKICFSNIEFQQGSYSCLFLLKLLPIATSSLPLNIIIIGQANKPAQPDVNDKTSARTDLQKNGNGIRLN